MKPISHSSSDSNPTIYIDLDLIEKNAGSLNSAAGDLGLEVVGVVKGVRGDLKIAEAFVRAGIGMLADSRIDNLESLEGHFSGMVENPTKLYLLRQPLLSEINKATLIADVITCHSIFVAELLDRAAIDLKKKINIVLPIDLGYGREGVSPDEIPAFLDQIKDLPSINVYGISVISNCEVPVSGSATTILTMNDVYPVLDQMKELVRISIDLFPSGLKHISGGNSGVVSLLFDKKVPEGIKQLTIGEAILLGRDTLSGEISPGLSGEAFRVDAEIMQVRKVNNGVKLLLAIGKQEIGSGTLSITRIPCASNIPGAQIISKISSDHLELFIPDGDQIENLIGEIEPGQKIMLYPDYFALLGLMVNPQIKKIYSSK